MNHAEAPTEERASCSRTRLGAARCHRDQRQSVRIPSHRSMRRQLDGQAKRGGGGECWAAPRACSRLSLRTRRCGRGVPRSRRGEWWIERRNSQRKEFGNRRHEAGQTISPSAGRTVTPGSGHGIAGSGVARSWVFDSSRPRATCQRCAGVTPSDARGLGRAPSSMKGWVLPMLAREGELRVAPVPRNRAFPSGRLCPARKTAPEGEDAGTPPARPPGQRERSRS